MFHKLTFKDNSLFINHKKPFNAIATFNKESIKLAFNFAYDMSFGKMGEHRNHRTGGTHTRKLGEIFANTFQGKLSEFAFYNTFYSHFPELAKPDLTTWDLGEWDESDFVINNYYISIKSTKAFGNLLLLEQEDWDQNAHYLPNKLSNKHFDYDFFIMIRLSPYCEEILKKNKLLYSNNVSKDQLENLILTNNWSYDIPGFISKEDLIYIIKDNFLIFKSQLLNGNTPMDATNYYIQSGDMKDIKILIELLKNKKN